MTTDVLLNLRTPQADLNSITLNLDTLTPLYTGGIGQWGEQIHPSGLLGSIRFFSCLVARTLGKNDFEEEVWGTAEADQHHAKKVALRWDVSRLKDFNAPGKLEFMREDDTSRKRAWFYNQAKEGRLTLTITRRGISDEYWNLLLLALRIQIRHATLGAKDQFGLGVVKSADLPKVKPLDTNIRYVPTGFTLQRCAFGRIELRKSTPRTENLDFRPKLQLALLARIALRNALRADTDSPPDEQARLKTLRHKMLGALNEFGSRVNVSAGYSLDDEETLEFRVFVQLRLDNAQDRTEVMRKFNEKMDKLPFELSSNSISGWLVQKPIWEYGGNDFGKMGHPAKWLNKLAGI